MENPLQIFEHEHFGKIRVVMIDGEPHFVGKDVATALGYSNSRDALSKHVPDKFKRVIKAKELEQMASQSKGRDSRLLECDSPRGLTFINEAGLYKLILRSKLPAAEDFSDWVCSEVLPSIRKTGSYSLVAKPAVKRDPVAIIPKAIYRVYAFLMEDGTVKFGFTKRFRTRISEIKRDTGLPVVDIYFTPFMLCENARLVERCCKEIFSSRRVKGEFFSVAFDEACAAIDCFVKLASAKPLVSNVEIGEQLLKVAAVIVAPSERQKILVQATEFLADKKSE